MVGWALSDPASAAKAGRATGYLLTTNLSVKWWAVAYPPTVRLRGRWKLAVLWQHWLHLIDKSPVQHSLNQLKTLMPGPEDSSLQTEKASSTSS